MAETRRTFLKKAGLAGAAMTIHPFSIFSQGSPNERVSVAVMGVRSRGLALAKEFAGMKDTEVAYLCDVDQRFLDNAIAEVSSLQASRPKGEKDIRKILEDKNVDAIAIAAPDHWHAPAALMSMAAGKHVYLEKPCSHNPREGELLIEAQQRYKRVLQMGNQRRSWPNVVQCIQDLHSGIIGRVYFAKGWYANNREPIGFGKEVAVPDFLDWDLWQGPAPRTAYRDNVHPYNWHWFHRWGTGEALNNGTHEIDVMRWGLGVDYPTRVVASGGRYAYQDDWQFPDTMVANFEFENGSCISWEGRSCNIHQMEGDGRGVIFYGEKGTLIQTGHQYKVYANDPEQTLIKEVKDSGNQPADSTNTTSPNASLDGLHILNFLDGMRSGTPVTSPINEGHKSVLMCQLANIAWSTGRVLHVDQRNGHIIGDKEAMENYWGREYEPGWEPRG